MDESRILARIHNGAAAWQLFDNDQEIPNGLIDHEIQQSWLRSKINGIDNQAATLPSISPEDKTAVSKEYTKYIVYLHDRFLEYYKLQENLLSELGGASVYLNSNLKAFHKGGSRALLDELKAVNIRYGTSFDEQNMGTNAAFLSKHTKKTTWTIGSEHYCDILKKYLMCAMPPFNSSTLRYSSLVLIFPLDKFEKLNVTVCEFLLQSYYRLYDYVNLPELTSRESIIEASLKRSNSQYILCSPEGQIIEANPEFYETFNVSPMHITGENIEKVIPITQELLECLESKKKTILKSVTLAISKVKSDCYIVEASPVYSGNSEYAGMLFILTKSEEMVDYLKNISDKAPYYTFDRIIGNSQSFQNVKRLAAMASSGKSNILLLGDSGTGKELFAQAIHNNTFPEGNHPFVALNCGGLPKDLLNSELFGYVDGAFTGARKGGSPGKFELADNGTLFLDEIAEMPYEMQTVLLRALEERFVTRLGSTKKTHLNVRLISATNKDLWQLVQEGRFRLDLYFRLNVVELRLPPLCERREDIPLLIEHFITKFAIENNKHIEGATAEFLERLHWHSWPGNVRELRNTIERSVSLSQERLLNEQSLPISFPQNSFLPVDDSHNESSNSIATGYAAYEQKLILELLVKHRGNKSRVAEEMGITRKTLYAHLKRHGFDK